MAGWDGRTLEVTIEAVKKAAEKCPQAKEVLQALFPTVFCNHPKTVATGQIYKRIETGEYFLVTRHVRDNNAHLQLTSTKDGNM